MVQPAELLTPPVNAIQFGFGQIWHQRLRPAKNAFRYAAWFVRLPLRTLAAREWQSGVPGLSVGARGQSGRFAVLHADHGDGQQNLLEWIENQLHAAGIDDALGEIWLQTFPRIVGYVFNPVSFWFCERLDGTIRAILCEVNNTFGERHCYLLANADGRALDNGQMLSAQKVFHVSPFCPVKGHYEFSFVMTRPESGDASKFRTLAKIDYADEDGLLLQTSIQGALEPVTPQAVRRAFWGYPWMTLGVMARIHWQALRLWFKGVPFFHKPVPPKDFVTRNQS